MATSIAVEQVSEAHIRQGRHHSGISISEGVLLIGMLSRAIPSPYTHEVLGEKTVLTLNDDTILVLLRDFSLHRSELDELIDDYRTKDGPARVNGALNAARQQASKN